MAINYGSNNITTTGNVVCGNLTSQNGQPSGRTLYFNGGDWATVSNWYIDAAKTTVASSIPTVEDTAIIDGSVTLSSCSSGNVEAHTIIFRDSSSVTVGPVLAKYILFYDTSYINNNITFGSAFSPTIVKFYNDSYISSSLSGLDFYGDVYFYDNADNGGSSSGAGGIYIYGNLYLNVYSGGSGYSYGLQTGGSYNYVYGDVYINNQYSSLATLLSYCYVYGSCHLARYASCTNCNFYGGNITVHSNSTIGSTNTFYACTVKVFDYGELGNSTFYSSVIRIDNKGSISNSVTVALYNASKLILNGESSSPAGAATISGDSNQTRVEVYQAFDYNGLHNASSITCGTLAFYGGSYLTSSTNVGAVDKIEFNDSTYLNGAYGTFNALIFNDSSFCNIEATSSNYFQFNDESHVNSVTIYGSNSDVYAEFNDNSYNDGTVSCEKVIFNQYSRNSGTVNYDAVFNDYSKNESSCTVNDDAVFNDFSSNEGTISGDATFTGLSVNTGTVSGSLIYRNVPTLLTPSSISSNQNDYDPGYGDVLRLEASGADRNITGLVLRDRYIVIIVNVGGTYNVVLKHQDSNSTAANRFITPTAGDHIIVPNGTATLLYDDTTDIWRVL